MAVAEPLSLRWAQGEVFKADERFRVLVAGRRFGKSYLSCELLKGCYIETRRNIFLLHLPIEWRRTLHGKH